MRLLRICLTVGSLWLLAAQSCRAGEEVAPPVADTPGCGCVASCGTGYVHDCSLGHFWGWLTYHPVSRYGCGKGKTCNCRTPPLFTYFLDHCDQAGHGPGCDSPAPCDCAGR